MLNKWIDYAIRLILIALAIYWFTLLYSDSSLLVILAIILLVGTTLYLITKEQSDLSANLRNLRHKFRNDLHFKK
ncbi:hypothetical protein [Companilactobacillus sp.]|jgi:hypothetical protein|uniref:hypothetical protein n=1 Tax=Companilactobacillus sp. TaxID=2767905 RepID=UPI0025BB7D75|nr:hypothetical protein [Companilactobacillus sp.]MCH4009899.1 hypothetical protein [Companilactobacillus sp.]MCH4052425.1 hypothetical protein [Companilactobacillus sp.]MCH4077841.1 hypothetical protein [Companilactobacillus sp.]MCH4126417.1 hypothetical protein [Companilactobacillus sp.]MCI1312739.1 hypothetical protein [Companilactobacillus sp.]